MGVKCMVKKRYVTLEWPLGVIYVSYPMRTNASDMIILLILKRDLDGNIYLIVCLNSIVCHVFTHYFTSEKKLFLLI